MEYTNNMKKEDKIKELVNSYYDNCPKVKPYADSLGWFAITNGYTSNLNDDVKEYYKSLTSIDYLEAEDHETYFSHFRPQELSLLIQKAEDNNGWTSIEFEDDLLGLGLVSHELGYYEISDKYTVDVEGNIRMRLHFDEWEWVAQVYDIQELKQFIEWTQR